jgi:hypothetical protein
VTAPTGAVGGRSWRAAEAARSGWYLFSAENPTKILLWAVGIRGVMQALFFILLGRSLTNGFGPQDAYLGAMALLAAGPNIMGVANVPLAEKDFGTFWRTRTAVLHPAVNLAVRALPYPAVGIGLLLVQGAATALLLREPALWVDLVKVLPLFALMALSAAVLGLAAATLSVARRADVLAPNIVTYLILLGSGALLPPGQIGWLDTVGTVVPARHGLMAVRQALAGEPWLAQAALELGVCGLWAVLGLVGLRLQVARAARRGQDDFA